MIVAAVMTIGCVSNPPRTDVVHVVAPGEDLRAIAAKYTGSADNSKAIAAHNGIQNPRRIKAGQQVKIPANLLPPAVASGAQTDKARTVTEGALTGGAIGAVTGALLCGNNRGACAAIGAGVGALGGALAGSLLAETKQVFVSKEERLNQEIAHAKKYNGELYAHNSQLAREIKALTAESNRLQQQYKRGKAQASQLASQKQKVSSLLAANQKLLTDSRTELSRQDKNYDGFIKGGTAANPNAEKLKKEITVLRTNIDKLDQETRKLAAVDGRLSV